MRNFIFAFIMSFFIAAVSYAGDSDVYIDQTGASATIDIVIDGQTNTIGSGTTDVTLSGANMGVDIDMVGAGNEIDGSFVTAGAAGATDLKVSQTGSTNDATLTVGTSAASSDVHVLETTVGDSNDTTYKIGNSATVEDVFVTIGLTGDSNVLDLTENSTATGTDKLSTVTITGNSNTPTILKSGGGAHNTIITHVGASSDFDLSQTGANSTRVDLDTDGANLNVDVVITD